MIPSNIPTDLNAEVLLDYYHERNIKIEFEGTHKRNAYQDILNIDERNNEMILSLGRNSLYNSLPEYMFHPTNRFDNIPQYDPKNLFKEELIKQEKEKENAIQLFAPIDNLLIKLRLFVRETLDYYTTENKIIQDIICDNLTETQSHNQYIKKTIPFIPYCNFMRGDRTLLTFLLRKVLEDEEKVIEIKQDRLFVVDDNPQYNNCVNDELDSLYVGNSFYENTYTYKIQYWSEEHCNEKFNDFVQEITDYGLFIQDFFLPIDAILTLEITTKADQLILSDENTYNYLNYNTYL